MSHKTDERKEYDRMRFSGELARKCGTECVSCGSKENIEYHHIIPLALGGSNRIRNIVPLCHRCHKVAHGIHHMSCYAASNNGGRKPKCDDETAFRALDLMLDGQIGNRKCSEMLNLSRTTRPKDTLQFQRWCEARGIKYIKNTLDVSIANKARYMCEGADIGEVIYEDGRRSRICFHDTGLNDDVAYVERGGTISATWGEMKERMATQRREKRLWMEEHGYGYACS